MECYIITGVSRGIGKALAMELAAPGRVVYAASRSAVPALEEHYRQKGLVINHRCVDLSDERGARNFGREVFLMVKESRPDAVFLINNAAMLDPVSPCGREEAWAYTAHIGLNLIAAMALTSEFLHAFGDMEAEKGVMNLSSGAGRTP
ncbi:MAG TPA: SDR family NAD(P)-dependent oxidoreductase, partial [Bacteroidales bacterium]|nr:SDR family NAD(P)-dependent oxidoreductase [Bacteroidales bacterium]